MLFQRSQEVSNFEQSYRLENSNLASALARQSPEKAGGPFRAVMGYCQVTDIRTLTTAPFNV
jgi:hypothetical protein